MSTFGSDYISRHLNEIQNPVWHDVYKAVIDWYASSTPRSWDEFLCNPCGAKLNRTSATPTAIRKWETELHLDQNFKWNKYYSMPFKYSKDSHLQWFQIRILHRTLPTNNPQTKMNIKANQVCTVCNQETETLLHLFWKC